MSSPTRAELEAYAGVPLPERQHRRDLPIYARVVVGGAGWFASLFFLFWFTLFCANVPSLWLVSGIFVGFGAAVARRAPCPDLLVDARNQATFVLGLSARLLIFVGLLQLTEQPRATAALMIPFELLFIAGVPDAMQRFVSALSVCSLLLFALANGDHALARELLGVLTAVAGGALLFARHPLERRAAAFDAYNTSTTQPAADLTLFTGSAVPIGLGLVTWSLGIELLRALDRGSLNLIGLLYGLVGALFVIWLAERYRLSPFERFAAIGGAVAIGALGWWVPGLPLALTLMLLGVHSRNTLLSALALGFFVVDGVAFYYELDTSLAAKGMALIGAGALFLLGRSLLIARATTSPTAPTAAWRRAVIALATVATLAFIAAQVADKEAQLASGEVVYLQLAPVDPRSLVQGDYMTLAYALDADVPVASSAVLTLDADGVFRSARPDDGTPLGADERRVRVSGPREGRRSRLASSAFLFQEGHAEQYEGARFGRFVLAGDKLILTHLTDAERRPLGHDRRRW